MGVNQAEQLLQKLVVTVLLLDVRGVVNIGQGSCFGMQTQ